MRGILWAVATALLTAGAAVTFTLTLATLCTSMWWAAPVPLLAFFVFLYFAESMFKP